MEHKIPHRSLETKAIMQLARQYSSAVIPDEYNQTLPIPNFETDSPQIIVFFAHISRREVDEKKVALLYPADYVVRVTYPEGDFVSLERVSDTLPSDALHADGSLGVLPLDDLSLEEYKQAEEEFLPLYDQLLAAYMSDAVASDVHQEKLRFRELFNLIHEKPYVYYYKTYGGQFFDWVWLD